MARARIGLLVAASLLPGCIELGVYRCGNADACADGTCEATGYCSYADDSCESGRRYSDLAAGALARACVEPEVATGSSESTASTASETTASATTDAPAECGNAIPEAGEECDDGDAVEGNGCNTDCRESGSVLWTASFAGADAARDTGFAVVVLGSGDVVAGGSEQIAALDDMLMIRLRSEDGGEVWSWRSPGDGVDRIEALSINAVGQIVAGGIQESPTEDDSAWMGVFDGGGELVYDDHPPGEIVLGVVGNAGGFIVAGGVQRADYDGFVAAYPEGAQAAVSVVYSELPGDESYVDIDRIAADDVFAIAWVDAGTEVHRVRDDMVEVVGAIAGMVQPQGAAFHDASGGLAVAGFRITAFANDAWIGLIADDGAELWSARERDVQLEVDEEFEDVAIDPQGNIVAAGFRTGDDKDAWVRKYDPEGVVLWTRRFEAPGTSVARAVDADGDGNIAITGEIDGEDGSLDFWVAKLAR